MMFLAVLIAGLLAIIFMRFLPFTERIAKTRDSRLKQNLRLVLDIADKVKVIGGRALVVGGYPRDLVLERELGFRIEPKDIDLEIYGIDSKKLEELLSRFGPVNKVGAGFAVYKVGDIDVAMPRRDIKTGEGHRDFGVIDDPGMSFGEAAKRRDFTINALGLDPLTGELFDAHGGIEDAKNRILRAIDYQQFGDDPLRVLRAMQFAGRFGFIVEEKTIEICRSLDLSVLSQERIGDEWEKLLLKSEKPSIGLKAARELQVFSKLHPEVEALFETPQEPRFHPEGDVGTHTLLVVDAMAALVRQNDIGGDKRLVLMLAALTHDFGKAVTTKRIKGALRSYSHAEAGVPIAKKFLKSIDMPNGVIEATLPLIAEHMVPAFSIQMKDAGVRRLANRLKPSTIAELVLLSKADQLGKGKETHDFSKEESLLQKAKKLDLANQAPKPLVLGRHLLEEGLGPGPKLGKVLRQLFKAQIEGKFATVDQGIRYFRQHYHDG